MKISQGWHYPLGATWDGQGVNFAVYSAHASGIFLCIFDPDSGEQEIARIPFAARTNDIWHMYVTGLGPGTHYGLRAEGPYDPAAGHRFNPAKLLIDPYARAIAGDVKWDDALYGFSSPHSHSDLNPDPLDSAPYVPKCVVVDPTFDWEGDAPPRIPWHSTIIYEAHVKGLTQSHPEISPELRGTYAGLSCPPILDHLSQLGITAIELLPVHQFIPDRRLVDHGLTNYWGYNTIGFFAPDARYASSGSLGQQVIEFKQMVKAFHRRGIEVILDVVYNHTGEGAHLGPTLSFRGLDNLTYYLLAPGMRRYYRDLTGTGNTLNLEDPSVLRLVMDSLRYWVTEMHVDGFRFDLSVTLGRDHEMFDPRGAFFDTIYQDPILSGVKLIAEPWDLGDSGYQMGHFPSGWAEWNDRFRDNMRDYWRSAAVHLTDLANRFAGSPDIFGRRGAQASINFITAHDGYTLKDLVTYTEKCNFPNLEENRDGHNDNRSANYGVEGPTDNPAINRTRSRQRRNFLAALLLSRGVPMLLAGDEFGNTQQGNNNAYCQDNFIGWLDWSNAEQDLVDFTRQLVEFRRQQAVFHHENQNQQDSVRTVYFRPDGAPIDLHETHHSLAHALQVCHIVQGSGEDESPVSVLLLCNPVERGTAFTLPGQQWGQSWVVEFDTCSGVDAENPAQYLAESDLIVPARSLLVLRQAISSRSSPVSESSSDQSPASSSEIAE